ncbi:MAG: hypothetical protein APF77_22285 [Clostridia bacterium BRH_c25]|nr:MAG: hypothetical protein APF77_22285 [Clostridia bacterium BRH_c25]
MFVIQIMVAKYAVEVGVTSCYTYDLPVVGQHNVEVISTFCFKTDILVIILRRQVSKGEEK